MNSSNTLATAIIAAVLVLILLGMYFGWQGRKKRQSHLAQPAGVPDDLGRVLVTAEVTYLATTFAGDPLNRIVVAGLGFRAAGALTVAEAGLVLSLAGGKEFFIPAADLRSAEQATWTVDRAVEEGGLLLIGWTMPQTSGTPDTTQVAVDSYFRVIVPTQQQRLIEAACSLFPASNDSRRQL